MIKLTLRMGDGSVYLMGAGSELLELVISVAGVASVSVDISAASPVSIGPGLGLFQSPPHSAPRFCP